MMGDGNVPNVNVNNNIPVPPSGTMPFPDMNMMGWGFPGQNWFQQFQQPMPFPQVWAQGAGALPGQPSLTAPTFPFMQQPQPGSSSGAAGMNVWPTAPHPAMSMMSWPQQFGLPTSVTAPLPDPSVSQSAVNPGQERRQSTQGHRPSGRSARRSGARRMREGSSLSSSEDSRSPHRSRSRSPFTSQDGSSDSSPRKSRDVIRGDDSSFEDFERRHHHTDEGDEDEQEVKSSMRGLRKLVRGILGDACPQPLPPKIPAVKSAVASELGRAHHQMDTPAVVSKIAKAALPLAPVVNHAWQVLEGKLRPEGSTNLETRLEVAGSKETPLLKPGPKALITSKLFSASRPPIAGFKPSYYKVHDSPVEGDHARAEEAVSSLMGSKKPAALVPFKDLELQEDLAKQSAHIASHQDWVLASLSRHLKGKGWLDATVEDLLASLGDANSHQAQFATRLAANSVLLRRTAVLKKKPDLDQGVISALRGVPIGSRTLFNEQLPQGLAIDQRLAGLEMKAPKKGDGKKGSKAPRRNESRSARRDRTKRSKGWTGGNQARGGGAGPSRGSRGRGSFRPRGGAGKQ